MSAASPDPVTGRLSARSGCPGPDVHLGRATAARRECLPERLGLLLGQRAFRSAVGDRLRVDPRPGPRMEAADDESVALGVGQREREALVATGVLEWVEPDEGDLLDRSPRRGLEDGGPRRQLVELPRDDADAIEVRLENGIEAATFFAARQGIEPTAQAACLAGQVDDEDEQQEAGDREADDGRSDDRGDGGVQVDR